MGKAPSSDHLLVFRGGGHQPDFVEGGRFLEIDHEPFALSR